MDIKKNSIVIFGYFIQSPATIGIKLDQSSPYHLDRHMGNMHDENIPR